jgi:predicted oxidoreductase (fatty acid repression mutant protein)
LIKQSNQILLSAFNAQDSRVIIVVVQVGAVKIYVAAVETLRINERQDETQCTTKIDGFLSFTPDAC